MAEFGFELQSVQCYRVSAPHLEQPVNLIVDIVDGQPFFNLTKSNKLGRLLCEDGGRKDVFKFVSVFDKLKASREHALHEKGVHKAAAGKSPSKFARAMALELDGTVVGVSMPAIAGVPGKHVDMLWKSEQGVHNAASIKLDAPTLEWLARVVAAERAAGVVQRAVLEPPSGAVNIDKGMTMVRSGPYAGSIRAKRASVDGGKNEWTYVKVNDDVLQSLNDARGFVTRDVDQKPRGGKRQSSITSFFGSSPCTPKSEAGESEAP